MEAFKNGFNEIVPLHLLKIFDEGELELLLGGIGAIDVRYGTTSEGVHTFGA